MLPLAASKDANPLLEAHFEPLDSLVKEPPAIHNEEDPLRAEGVRQSGGAFGFTGIRRQRPEPPLRLYGRLHRG